MQRTRFIFVRKVTISLEFFGAFAVFENKITTSCQVDMTSSASAVYILPEYCNPINIPTDAPYLEHPPNRDVDLNELLVQTN